jgi:hypothetical protein
MLQHRVRIGLQHPLACSKRQPNGTCEHLVRIDLPHPLGACVLEEATD